MKLNKRSLGLAAGVLWGGCLFLITLISMGTGYALEMLQMLAGLYPGYSVSIPGSIIGLIYGFLDGFIGLYIFGWLYNRLD